jgi:hypothetical protein
MFSKKLPVVCLIRISVLLLVAAGVRAQDLVSARVLYSEGQVEIRRQSGDQPQVQKIAFKANDALSAGDTIVTGRGARLVLGLSDGSQAVIAPQTTVVIQDLKRSPRTLFHVIRGKTRVQIEKLGGEPNPYRVNTPTAVIAVRGTVFDVLVKDDQTEVFLHEGEVVVTNLALPDQPVTLFAGQMTRVFGVRLPNRPSAFKPGRNDDTFRRERQNQENRQIADRRANPDFTRGGSPTQGGREGGRPEARPDSGRADSQSNRSRPNTNSGGGGRRP